MTAPGDRGQKAAAQPPRNRLSWAEAERLVAFELDGIRNCAHRIDELRSDPTFVRLGRASLVGVTRQRWDTAYAALKLVERRHRRWQIAVREARDQVTRHGQGARGGTGGTPDDGADLDRIGQLLRENSVPLSREEMLKGDRPPPGSESRRLRFSLTYVKSLIENDLSEARRLVREVADVWDAFLPRLERLTTDLSGCERAVPGAVVGGPPSLAAFRVRLDDTRAAVETDPLVSRADPDRGHLVDPARLDRLEEELEGLRCLAARPGPETEALGLLYERLKIYWQRAMDHGHADRPGLVTRYDEARRRIRTAAGARGAEATEAAERAVQAYAAEVWRLRGDGDGPRGEGSGSRGDGGGPGGYGSGRRGEGSER